MYPLWWSSQLAYHAWKTPPPLIFDFSAREHSSVRVQSQSSIFRLTRTNVKTRWTLAGLRIWHFWREPACTEVCDTQADTASNIRGGGRGSLEKLQNVSDEFDTFKGRYSSLHAAWYTGRSFLQMMYSYFKTSDTSFAQSNSTKRESVRSRSWSSPAVGFYILHRIDCRQRPTWVCQILRESTRKESAVVVPFSRKNEGSIHIYYKN